MPCPSDPWMAQTKTPLYRAYLACEGLIASLEWQRVFAAALTPAEGEALAQTRQLCQQLLRVLAERCEATDHTAQQETNDVAR